jgi:lipopolysaccharide/colanic/teichoic acid biosynthesis glycosyltransferase
VLKTEMGLKRIFDLMFVGTSIFLWLPACMAVGLLVSLKIGWPVLFRQIRPGLFGRPFKIYKFRTMNEARDDRGNLLPDGQRITPVGRFLRSTSLDELPELMNVLAGDMSLVGPRPLLMEYLPLYTAQQARRHEVKPGITGWAQINGRNAISWEEKFDLDVWYVDHRSLRLDINILFFTLIKVFKREGISQDGHATMPFFKGSACHSREAGN